MTLPFAHPSRSKLRAWLSSLAPSEKVTSHVESCERCASQLMELDDAADETPFADVATADVVKAEWAPPADFTARVIRVIDERERNERDLTVVLGLFGIATETASLMLTPEPDPEPDPASDVQHPDERYDS